MPLNRRRSVLILALLAFSIHAHAQTRAPAHHDEAHDETPQADADAASPEGDALPKDVDDHTAPASDAPEGDDADRAESALERPASTAPTTRLREDLRTGRTLKRHYVRTTTHETTVERRARTHTLHDRVREEFVVALRYGVNEADPAQIEVRVLDEPPSDPTAVRLLEGVQGHVLACWQERFGTICRDQSNGRAEVQWPGWAVLDFDAWLTNSAVQTGSRWWRTLPSADVAGWDDSHRGETQLQMEVQRPAPNDPRNIIRLEGALETDAEFTLYGEKTRFEARGEVDADYNTDTELLGAFGIEWKSSVEHEGLVNGEPIRWQRETHVDLRIGTSVP